MFFWNKTLHVSDSISVHHQQYYKYRQFNFQQLNVLPTQLYLCVLCGFETNSDYFPIQH